MFKWGSRWIGSAFTHHHHPASMLDLNFGITKHDLKILPCRFLDIGLTKQVGGMIGHQDFALMELVKFSTQSSHRKFCLQKFMSADGPKTDDVIRSENRKLRLIKAPAILAFVQLGVAIVGWSTFDGIKNVDVFPAKFAGFDHLGEQLACFAHERSAQTILLRAWSFAKENNSWSHVAFSKNGCVSAAR